jgi:hypothetical protein
MKGVETLRMIGNSATVAVRMKYRLITATVCGVLRFTCHRGHDNNLDLYVSVK